MPGVHVVVRSTPAPVRGRELLCSEAYRSESGDGVLLVQPLGPARLWDRVRETLHVAFVAGLEEHGSTAARRSAVLARCTDALLRLRASLLEPNVALDARLALLVTGPGEAAVALTEGVRLYRGRGGAPERLYGDATRAASLCQGAVFETVLPTVRGDLLVVGTREAFTVPAMGRMATLLAQPGREVPPSELAEAIIEPCRTARIAAACAVLGAPATAH